MATANVTAILRWYASHQRDLPWRRPDATAWAILVSEVMLQQTPVTRVLPVYEAWLTRWPTPGIAGRRAGRGRRASLGAPWIPAARAAPACDGSDPGAAPWGPGSRVGGCAGRPARDRRIHGRRGGELRVRATAGGTGHERAAGPRPPVQRPGTAAVKPAPPPRYGWPPHCSRRGLNSRRDGRWRSWNWARWYALPRGRTVPAARCPSLARGGSPGARPPLPAAGVRPTRAPTGSAGAACSRCSGRRPVQFPAHGLMLPGRTHSSAPGRWTAW